MKTKPILLAIVLILGAISLILAFTGLPGTYNTEPLLAIGIIILAIASLLKK